MYYMQKLYDFIKASSAQMVELETLLTSHPALAPENGGQGEIEKAKALVEWLKANGIQESQIEEYDAPDSRVESKIRPNIVVTIPGQNDDYSVWVMAHLDVVPVGELKLWNSDPWKVIEKDGKLYGRGVEDNQQGLVSGVFAALAFVKNGVKPAHTVKLLFMADEEVGSKYGIIWLLHNTSLFGKNDIYLIPDGGDPKGETIEVAEKNILWLKVHVLGKQCHGSRPDQGNNACIAACDLSLKLHDLEKVFCNRDALFEPDYSTFQPTMRLSNVSGVNIIPGEDTFCMDCRILPCYKLDEVLGLVEVCCSEIEQKYGVEVCYETLQMSESPATSVDSPVVKKLAKAINSVHALKARTIGIGGGTVGAELRREGFPCVVWSTMDELAHMPNEYCLIENIQKDAETLISLFADKD
ncbi:MAG: M20 family metallo-hydrolase [Treponema sp.]|nr:M20 family metallo-hydrolase [Treponema sp.]